MVLKTPGEEKQMLDNELVGKQPLDICLVVKQSSDIDTRRQKLGLFFKIEY